MTLNFFVTLLKENFGIVGNFGISQISPKSVEMQCHQQQSRLEVGNGKITIVKHKHFVLKFLKKFLTLGILLARLV